MYNNNKKIIIMHLYADNTQVYDHLRVNKIERSVAALEACLQDIGQWSSQRRLKLSPSITELTWFWLDRGTQSKSSNNSHWFVSIPKNYQALHRSEIREWSSTPTWLHPGKNVFLSVGRNSTGEEKPGRRLCQNSSPCTCSITSGLLQLGTGQLARSDACTTYLYSALRCTA